MVHATAFMPYESGMNMLFQWFLTMGLAVMAYQFEMGVPSTAFIRKIGVGLSRYAYTLYVIHFPLLILPFSGVHPWFHEAGIIARILYLIVLVMAILCVASWFLQLERWRSKRFMRINEQPI